MEELDRTVLSQITKINGGKIIKEETRTTIAPRKGNVESEEVSFRNLKIFLNIVSEILPKF